MISTLSFDMQALWPLAIIFIIAVIVPILLSILKLKIIPSLVLEILAGVAISFIPPIREYFAETLANGKIEMNLFSEGLYAIGLSMLLFLSGLDTDFSVFKENKEDPFDELKYSMIAFAITFALSFLASLLFINQIETNKVAGLFLLTICFSSTFASLVIPLVHEAKIAKTTIGRIIGTYATIAEFVSIVGLSIVMIVLEIVEDRSPLAILVMLAIFAIVFVVLKFVDVKKIFGNKLDGIVHLSTRANILVILLSILLADMAGMEYILGAFILGMILSFNHIKHSSMEKCEVIGYGIFVPIFYILAGFKIGIALENIGFSEFFTIETLVLFILVVLVMLVVKAPFMYLLKYFKVKTTLLTLLISTSTIIVALTIEHLSEEAGIFNESFVVVLIVASWLTCILPPILFANKKDFSEPKEEYKDYIYSLSDIASSNQKEHE